MAVRRFQGTEEAEIMVEDDGIYSDEFAGFE
jgi:hypothetical protein